MVDILHLDSPQLAEPILTNGCYYQLVVAKHSFFLLDHI